MQENLSIILLSVAITSLAAFAIFVPLVIIPSISDMAVTYDFDPTPVLCVTVDSVIKETTSECSSWSFCKQDCEAPASRCYQILINYRKFNRSYETIPEVVTEAEMQNTSLWDESFTRLLVNAKGCGESPDVRCNEFGETVGTIGSRFGCYYSRRNPRLVVIDPKWVIPTSSLAVTLGLPATLLTTSIFIFCFLAAQYCPCVPNSERLKPEGVKTQQGRYSSIQDVNPKA